MDSADIAEKYNLDRKQMDDKELKRAFKKLAGSKMQTVAGKVLSVDKTNCTCLIQPVDGTADIPDARLRASIDGASAGVVIFPAVDSKVICSMIMDSDEAWSIIKMDEVESVLITVQTAFKCEIKPTGELILNDGVLGGLIKINELLAKINALEERMNTHQHLTTTPGNPTTPDVVTNPLIVPTTLTEIQNDKIQHG